MANVFVFNPVSGQLDLVNTTPPASGANQQLSNLTTPTAVNEDILPGTNNTESLGSSSKAWAEVHTYDEVIHGATSGSISIHAADATTSYSVKWPSAQGGASTVLQNDSSGNLSWASVAAANQSLSNLTSPTSINQDLIPQSGKNLGDATHPWNSLITSTIDGASNTNVTIAAQSSSIQDGGTVNINAGDSSFSGGGGGSLNINAGNSTDSNFSASITVGGGVFGSHGGDVSIGSGGSSDDNGGSNVTFGGGLVGGPGGSATISGGPSSDGNLPSRIQVNGAVSASNGGDMFLRGGDGVTTGSSGGGVIINGGSSTDGTGGSASLFAGDATDGGQGGQATVQGGQANGEFNGGDCVVKTSNKSGDNGVGDTGQVHIFSGNNTADAGGNTGLVEMYTGDSTIGSTGNVSIATGSGDSSGNINMTTGSAASSDLRGIVNINALYTSVNSTPIKSVLNISSSYIAGESFAANTSFIVRWALDGETAGRVYSADSTVAADNKYWAVGIAFSSNGASADDSIDVVTLGTALLGSEDTNFDSTEVGLPVWLTSSGGFSTVAPSSSGNADFKIGMVQDVNKIHVIGMQLTLIN